MAIGVYFNFPNTSLEQYDEVCRAMNGGQTFSALSDWPGGGCLEHSAWAEESGALGIFDVWESPEAFQRFGETLMPQLTQAGITPAEPHVVELHNFVSS